MKKKLSYIWILTIAAVAFIYGCNKEDLLHNSQEKENVALKMTVKNDVLVSGDSLSIVFDVEGDAVAGKDIEITLSVSNANGEDASQHFLGFIETVVFPRGEKSLTKNYSVSKLKMAKINVELSASCETNTITGEKIPLTITNNPSCNLNSFLLDGREGEINQEDRTVLVYMVYGADLTALEPVLEVSLDASYSPEGKQDFSSPVEYTITAQDGETKKVYTVSVKYAKNDKAVVESFILGNYPAVIDQANRVINVNVPTGTNAAELTASLTLAYGATYEKAGDTYTVTAEDGVTTQEYSVSIVEKAVAPLMVFVEGGTFTMGAGGASMFEATISKDLFVSTLEIMWGEYGDLLGEDRASVQGWRWKPAGPTIPMTCLSWFDACDFSNKLSIEHGLEPYYTISDVVSEATGRISSATVTINDPNGKGYRLPTEAEWEFIARGGKYSQGYIYPGGDVATELGWVQANATNVYNNWGEPHPGANFKANELGIFDMVGNVREWCWDWAGGEHPAIPTTDPMGPESGTNKVTRGGCYWTRPTDNEMEMWERGKEFGVNPNHASIGFRIVRNK
ncbi:SUMF1/EgtB/PvdO family nonheme iron enzyme [Maribellus sp. CM-23]|uniref:SUMF1/EgtB/PvdO family nonheme iron enzyme n=1 Tax=Maribellus sp. CM-23 TaxID=2781026 RepID=UPI001F454237|nr:SUMF1/EgtB/PvdO family nonheme iron enzyme [Maribellus sp. CM-23]MCE4563975.1 SUMF1/EgtB/PvdO family nonheme iron enzyme [Maribellus sp. CM-23]